MINDIHATGSCNCGAITFSVITTLSSVYICHCSICRKSTGSGGIAVTVVPTDSFSINTGLDAIQKWEKPDHNWLTNFCEVCGSPVPGKNDSDHSYIPVSLLDSGHEGLEVKHHIFVDSKASWEEIGKTGKQHGKNFSGE